MGLFSRKKPEAVKPKAIQKEPAVQVEPAPVKKEPAAKSMKELYADVDQTKVIKKTAGGQLEIKKFKYQQAYRWLLKPVITEKGTNLGALNKYVFAVSPQANKVEIAKAVKKIYGINPRQVNIIKMSGKKVRRGRISGQRKDWKKAIVTLPQGKTINLYEGV